MEGIVADLPGRGRGRRMSLIVSADLIVSLRALKKFS
jgi:hypothetical protein